jgi:hypothetical protein
MVDFAGAVPPPQDPLIFLVQIYFYGVISKDMCMTKNLTI